MNRPSLIALAVVSVLATLGHGATAASWTQVRANEIIGAQESGEAPALKDVDLKLDESTFPYGASAMAVEVAGTREASAVHNSLTLTLRQSPSFYLDHLIGAEVSARSEDHAVRALGRGNTVNLALDDSSTLILDRITGADVWVSGPQGSVAQAEDNHVVVTGDIKLMRSAHGARVSAACEGCEAIASRNSLTIMADAFEEMWIAAQMRMAGAEVSAWGAAQASDNTLSVEAKTITASGRWVGASVESYASALAQGNELNVIADELIASSSPGEGITQFYASLVDGPTGAAYGSRVNMQIGNVSAQEMAIYGAQVSGESAEALNNRVAVRFDELSAERLNLYGARAETWPASMSEQTSAQAIASGNELSVVFGTVHGDSDITAAAGKAEASGQNAVSVADGNSTTIEIDEIVASSSVPIIDIQGGVSSAGNEMGDPLSLSAQASASGNVVTGRFGNITDSDMAMVAGSAWANAQNAVSVADGNRLAFDVSSLVSNPVFLVTGGESVAGTTYGSLLPLSAQASASGNVVTGHFESISDSNLAMAAGNARAYGQDAVSFAEGNHLTFETAISVSNSTLEFYGGYSAAESASGDPQSAQASASGNKVSGRFESVSDSTISIIAGRAEAYGQNAVAFADSNHLDLEISSLSSSNDSGDDSRDVFSVIGGNSVIGSLGFASLLLSAQTSASGNEVSGRFESVSDSFISMIAGSAAAYGQKAVSSADGNRLTFEIATSVSNSTLDIQGGLAMAGGASGDSQSAQASASGNLVTGSISGSVGQSSSLGIYGGRATAVAQDSTAVADNNQVQLTLTLEETDGSVEETDGSMQLLLLGASARALTTAVADGNLLRVSGGADTAIKGTLYGAQVEIERSDSDSAQANASGNRVEVSGIDLTGSITGALVENRNSSGSVNAEGNVVVISSSTIKGDVTGANLQGSHINAGGNTVILTEGTVVDGNVTAVDGANAGSMRFLGGDYSSVYSNNRVVMNNATVTGAVSGMSSDSGSLPVDMQTAGNTLVLAGHNEAGTIAGFETLDLTLSEQNKTQSVLTLTHGESTLSDATIVIRGAEVLEQGKLIEVVDGANLSVKDATVELRGTFIKKVAQNVDFTVTEGEGNGLTTDSDVLASAKVQATESASSLSESLLGTAAFVRQGAEFVADDGLATMEFAARSKQGLNAFAVMQGSSLHYDALSGVDVSGFTLLAGAAVQQGNLTFASFVESGWGNSEGDIAKNSTDLSYFGVGLAARYRFESGFYGEGAVRLGRASSDFAANFAEDGDCARYESDVFYATMNMAAGYELPLNDFVTADMYARYTFSFLDNDSVDLNDAAQSRAELDSVVAHALRIGARVKGGFTDAANWKAGIAYEHMFDGAAGGTVDGVSITEAEMDGGSVIGELGVSVKPGSETSPWTLQFALKGYLGEREGVSGNGMLVYSF